MSQHATALINVAHVLASRGLVQGTNGNLSFRRGREIAITAGGVSLAQLRTEDVSIVDPCGAWLAGSAHPSSELALHLAVYAATDASAIVHAHPPMATAVACAVDELPFVHYEMHHLGGPVRVAPYATFGTQALADRVVVALEGRRAALMANHGTLTYGDDLPDALRATEILEFSAGVFVHASAIGHPNALDEAELPALRARADEATRR